MKELMLAYAYYYFHSYGKWAYPLQDKLTTLAKQLMKPEPDDDRVSAVQGFYQESFHILHEKFDHLHRTCVIASEKRHKEANVIPYGSEVTFYAAN